MTIQLGVALRSMGEQSVPGVLLECARIADQSTLSDLWVQDHIAIAPDDAEGSNGRYLDPLTTLAWIGASTSRIGLGTGVLILPYRSALPTLKAIATVQEFSLGRLRLGVGVGWMGAEFRALEVDRQRRGHETDRVLDLFRRCFESTDDIVEINGQPFLFRPHPSTPPVFIGGAPPHALKRTVRYGDGWMPMGTDPEQLAPAISELHALAAARGRSKPEVAALGAISLEDPGAAAAQIHKLEQIGVTRLIQAFGRYANAREFGLGVERLVRVQEAL